MARPLRISFPGAFYHVMARGNGKALIFLDDRDYGRFLEILEVTYDRYRVICHAFCLMPNHYHLVVETPGGNLSLAVKHLNGVYAQWWNTRHERCGHVLQGRFKAQLIQEERYLLTVCRYVVRNPVRAGLTDQPGGWPWSSFRASAGMSPAPRFLGDAITARFPSTSGERNPGEAYRRFVNGDPPGMDVGRAIREDSRFIGDERFVSDSKLKAGIASSFASPGKERRSVEPTLAQLFGHATGRPERDSQIYRARKELGYRVSDIASCLGLDITTVSRVLRSQRLRESSWIPRGSGGNVTP